MRWLGGYLLIPPNLFIHSACWCVVEKKKKIMKGFYVIWLTTIRVMWKARNNKVFNSLTCGVEKIVEEIKVLSWRWSLSRLHILSCLFYEWTWNPKDCLLR